MSEWGALQQTAQRATEDRIRVRKALVEHRSHRRS